MSRLCIPERDTMPTARQKPVRTFPCRWNLLLLAPIAATLCCAASAVRTPEAGRDAQGAHAAVTSDHRLATEAGVKVLQRGGNALGAPITVAGVLSVARAHIDGGGGVEF